MQITRGSTVETKNNRTHQRKNNAPIVIVLSQVSMVENNNNGWRVEMFEILPHHPLLMPVRAAHKIGLFVYNMVT